MQDLTPRERQVARLLATGQGTKAIAAELVITSRTVYDHTAAIRRKLDTSTTLSAALKIAEGIRKHP